MECHNRKMNIVLIGAGNVSASLGAALKKIGHNILQIYSRTEQSATFLAKTLSAEATCNVEAIRNDADIYFICIPDDAISTLAKDIVKGKEDRLFIHTAGSVNIDVLPCKRRGAVWPIHSFSKENVIDNWKEIPLFIEASNSADLLTIKSLVSDLSEKVFEASSRERKYIHLAAVFCNNFSNHCYALAEQLLNDCNVPFDTFLPLIDLAAKKVHNMSPQYAQSGPAARGDIKVMKQHIDMLNDYPSLQNIYKIMSESIMQRKENVSLKLEQNATHSLEQET